MSLRVAGLVASTRRRTAASGSSMSMPTVRPGSSRSTAATVVTSWPRGPTTINDEAAFRLALNDDAMATEKLAEGIRLFCADAHRLDALIHSR